MFSFKEGKGETSKPKRERDFVGEKSRIIKGERSPFSDKLCQTDQREKEEP